MEEYFHATAMEPFIPPSRWESIPRRCPQLIDRILEHLDEHGVRATFFVLGWLAEKEPAMVRAIANGGHEIASHGWSHRRVTHLEPETFREEVRRSRSLLEDLSGGPVVGFRAPSFSILPGYEWAFDVLIEEGYRYDSSVFPVRVHPTYGYPNASRDPYVLDRPSGRLAEVPPATLRVAGVNLPSAGGAYLRFFPVALVRAALVSAGRRDAPGTIYVHPWEFDREMPPTPGPWVTRLRMNGGIGQMERRVGSLTKRFRFLPMRETAERLLLNTEAGPV
ncbi:MAG TPA: XrtA system polysaccharide deacetylase [Longimicrobiales bacterium]|nr:XrtA system polysaccharide deacetylase [Longimicrobiales bacterium]